MNYENFELMACMFFPEVTTSYTSGREAKISINEMMSLQWNASYISFFRLLDDVSEEVPYVNPNTKSKFVYV
jgi:hypothetical protein